MVKYIIRPSKRQELLDIIYEKYTGDKRSRGKSVVVYNKPMTYTRWANWFDLNTLDEALMEEGYEEVEVDNVKHFNVEATDEELKDLGI